MNVSIATVADDLGTTITGIQTAITLYTLVMATLMITGGKIGAIIGRRRAFAIGCVIYGRRLADHRAGAEPAGAAHRLVVAGGRRRGADHARDRGAGRRATSPPGAAAGGLRPGRGGGAIAIAVGPLIGGVVTTYFSWRWVFAGEVIIVLAILLLSRRIADAVPGAAAAHRPRRLGAVGHRAGAVRLRRAADRRVGLGEPKPGAPSWFGHLAGALARSSPACSWSGSSSAGRPGSRRAGGIRWSARRCFRTGS